MYLNLFVIHSNIHSVKPSADKGERVKVEKEMKRNEKRKMSAWYELCSCCEEKKVCESCNKCGGGVCEAGSCSVKFPHYGNTRYIICMECNNVISGKLCILIDYSKLSLLKVKIGKMRSVGLSRCPVRKEN